MSNLYGLNSRIGPSGVALVPGPPGPPGPAGSPAGTVSISNVAGPATVAGAALIEYACDVRPGALTINLPTLSAGQVVMVVWVAGSLTANPITVNAPGGVVLGLPTGLGFSGSTAASIVFNNDAMAPFAFGWWNYGISGIYNIK